VAIYELVSMDDTLRRMIHDGAAEQDLEAHARRSSPSLQEVGRRAVLDGLTTPEELLRVTQLG
jgi:general secretion pathway protein E